MDPVSANGSLLTAIVTHLDAARVRQQLAYLHAVAPGARFVVCHGGARSDFEELDLDDSLFVDDPSLRGPNRDQSYTATLRALYETFVRDDPGVELVYLIEYDQLILRPDFDRSLAELAGRTGAGLLAKHASARNDTNWPHYTRYRENDQLNRFFARISRRDDAAQRWGCLGTGLLFRRDALAAFCSVDDVPHAYLEMLVPTVIHHLGFDVVNVDALSDLYAAIRWRPPFTAVQALAEARAGRTFVHPFKELDALGSIAAGVAPREPQNSSRAGSLG